MSDIPHITWEEKEVRPLLCRDGSHLAIMSMTGKISIRITWDKRQEINWNIIGRVNGRVLRLANHLALPETLLLSSAIVKSCWIEACGQRWADITLYFTELLERGPCEDRETHFVGWNRIWRPESQRWERVKDAAGKTIYLHAEEVGGFEQLWSMPT